MIRRRRTTGSRHDSRHRVIVAGLLGILILAGFGYLALTAENGLPGFSYYYLNADFKNASQLDTYSDVRIAGTLAGQVLGSSFHDGEAVVRLQLDGSRGPLRASSTARIRLQSAIGAKYIELYPGATGPELRSGATLPSSHTSTTVDVFDVLNTFDAKRRAALRAMLGGLGRGFAGRGGQLNQALSDGPAVVSQFGQVAGAVNARPGAAENLIPGTESLAAAIDPVRTDLAASFAPSATSLQPLLAERPSVQSALTELPGALKTMRGGLAQSDPLLVQTAGLSRELVSLTGPAPAALGAATTLLRNARTPLTRTGTLLRTLAGAVPTTLGLLGRAAPLAEPTTRSLTNTIPWLYQLGRYSCDISSMAADWYRIFELGTGPTNSAGLSGFIRVAFVVSAAAAGANTPGAVTSHLYPAPCTENLDRLR
jgi:virulence factor Mce-like protein